MKAKQWISIFLLVACLCAFAAAGMAAGRLVLPENLTEIKAEAFEGNTSLDEVVLPEGIETIGSRAFADSSVASINLPSSITYIADDAFDGCESTLKVTAEMNSYAYDWALEMEHRVIPRGFVYEIESGEVIITDYYGTAADVRIPELIEGYPVVRIGDKDFFTSEITSVVMPDTLTSIGSNAFASCEQLEEVVFAEGITVLEYGAFCYCYELNNVVLPEGMIELGDGAFAYCETLTNISLPESLQYIGDEVFIASGLTSIDIPSGVESMGYDIFFMCYDLESIAVSANNDKYTSSEGILFDKDMRSLLCYPSGKQDYEAYEVPTSVTSIGYGGFQENEYLTHIILPEGVEFIDAYAFYYCTALERVDIPATVTGISEDAFMGCSGTVIYGIKGSYAETYAENVGFSFVEVESSAPIGENDMCIILEWGSVPDDLDSHLYAPTVDGEGTYHLYYADDEYYYNNVLRADLDTDDTSSYGQETVTVYGVTNNGIYRYYVQDFSNKGDDESTELAESGAQVSVFIGENEIATINVPTTGAGDVWHVFDYNAITDSMHVVNEITNNLEDSLPTVSGFALNNAVSEITVFEGDTLEFSGVINANEYTLVATQASIFDAEDLTKGVRFARVEDIYQDTFNLSSFDSIIVGDTYSDENQQLTMEPGKSYVVMLYVTDANGNGFANIPSILVHVKSFDEDDMRVFLEWEDAGEDFDAHLWGPTADGLGRYHLYWGNERYYYDDEHWAELQYDNPSAAYSYGWETITIYGLTDNGIYRYYVHDYGGDNTSSILANSGAQVKVFIGKNEIASYDVPTMGEGDVWYVFDYDAATGSIHAVNQIINDMEDEDTSTFLSTVSDFTLNATPTELTVPVGSQLVFGGTINAGSAPLMAVQASVFLASDHEQGAVYERAESIGADTFDLSGLSPMTVGAEYNGFAMTAGNSYDVVLYVTDENGNGFESDPSIRVNVVEPDETTWYANVTDEAGNALTSVTLPYTGEYAGNICVRTNNGNMTAWADDGFPFELELAKPIELQADGSYLFTYTISAPLDMTGMAKTDTILFCLRDENGVAMTDAPLAQLTVTQEANVDLPVIYSIVDSEGNNLMETPLTLDYTGKCETNVIVHSNTKAITAWFNVNTSIDFGAPEETLLEDGTYQLVYRNVTANENVTASDIARTCVFYAYTTDATQPDKSRTLAEVEVVQDGNPKVPTAVILTETNGSQTIYNQDKPIELRVGQQRKYKLSITAEKPESAVYKLYSDNPDAVSVSYDAASSEVTVQINDGENANIYISYDQSADKVEEVPKNRLFKVCTVDVIVYRALAVAMDLHEDLVGVGGIIWGTTVSSDAGISDYTSMHEAIRMSDTYQYTYIRGYFNPTVADYATYRDNLINDGVDDNDVTVLYVSTHGGKNKDKNPVEYSIAFANASVVIGALRKDVVDMIPGKVVFVLDSCYSGAFRDEFDNDNYTRKNVAIITACDTDELSGMYGSVGITGEVKNYSISTYHLTQGAGYDYDDGKITMRADDGDGELTLKEWYEYARDETLKDNSSQNMQWWTGSKEMEELVLFGR